MQSVTHHVPGLVVTEHTFTAPLDHGDPRGERIELFARELADPEGLDRPYLLFFAGGPGYEAVRPSTGPRGPGWLDRALQDFRVLLLDQRGTGRSSPVGVAEASAERLAHFRADAIVHDAEWLRRALGVDRWSVLGQSFGGFCVTAYLSSAPDALQEAFITGGLPAIGHAVDEVYEATYAELLARSRRYYERYPEDRARAEALWGTVLPSGDVLTQRRVQALGIELGAAGGFETVHHLLELPPGSPAALADAEAALPFARNPLYAVLHESCWADGGATRWSADRVRPAVFDAEPWLLTGEHVGRWLFDDVAALRPWAEAAEALADRDWPRLYDEDVLRGNEVPVAAAVYANDAYVPRAFSEETARMIRGLRPWVTSEYEHNGLRADGARVLGHLLDLVRGRA